MTKSDIIRNLFGSNTRVKLLSLFLNNATKSYYVREITRLIDEQINSVRRELTNLETVGLIKKADRDRKVFYQINAEAELFQPLRAMFVDENEPGLTVEAEDVTLKPVKLVEQVIASCAPDNHDDDLKINWQEEVTLVKNLLKKLIVFGDLVGNSEAEIDVLLVGDNSSGQLSTWMRSIERKLDAELRYMILEPRDFNYRVSAKDKSIGRILDYKHCIIYDESV